MTIYLFEINKYGTQQKKTQWQGKDSIIIYQPLIIKYMESFIISLFASLIAVLIALWIEKKRMPKLVINTSESANSDNTYREPNPHANERWKFFRVEVENRKFPKLLSWIPRQTAENCRAKIEFYKKGESSPIFAFAGRWASTPEIPHIPNEAIVKLQHPDPVTIPVCEKENLDVITKAENDDNAYGWNNESYFHDWKNPNYKLNEGEYIVKVTINTQNGISFDRKFKLAIRKKIENTILELL